VAFPGAGGGVFLRDFSEQEVWRRRKGGMGEGRCLSFVLPQKQTLRWGLQCNLIWGMGVGEKKGKGAGGKPGTAVDP
jgi:hypothetical protein